MDFKEIKKLVELVEEAQITHLGLEEDGVKIEIKKKCKLNPLVLLCQHHQLRLLKWQL